MSDRIYLTVDEVIGKLSEAALVAVPFLQAEPSRCYYIHAEPILERLLLIAKDEGEKAGSSLTWFYEENEFLILDCGRSSAPSPPQLLLPYRTSDSSQSAASAMAAQNKSLYVGMGRLFEWLAAGCPGVAERAAFRDGCPELAELTFKVCDKNAKPARKRQDGKEGA